MVLGETEEKAGFAAGAVAHDDEFLTDGLGGGVVLRAMVRMVFRARLWVEREVGLASRCWVGVVGKGSSGELWGGVGEKRYHCVDNVVGRLWGSGGGGRRVGVVVEVGVSGVDEMGGRGSLWLGEAGEGDDLGVRWDAVFGDGSKMLAPSQVSLESELVQPKTRQKIHSNEVSLGNLGIWMSKLDDDCNITGLCSEILYQR